MIRVEFHFANQQITSFQMTGHADFAEYGSDIVCAGVSALAISTVNNLAQLTPTEPTVQADQANGGLLKVNQVGLDHDSQLLLTAFYNGLLDIAERYDQYIEIKMIDN